MDAIQSEDSHFVSWFVHMMAGTNGLVAWSLLKGELGINEDRKRPAGTGNGKWKLTKQITVKADLDGSSLDLNHNNKILKSDWLSTALFQP